MRKTNYVFCNRLAIQILAFCYLFGIGWPGAAYENFDLV